MSAPALSSSLSSSSSSPPNKRVDALSTALSSTKKIPASTTTRPASTYASSSWKKSSPQSHLNQNGQRTHHYGMSSDDLSSFVVVPSLVYLCRKTIGNKIERYPPHAFASLSESEFESIVELRHAATAPCASATSKAAGGVAGSPSRGFAAGGGGGGGLDGTGRRMPAVSHRVMRSIEDANPHLRDSTVSDELVWRDCVEFTFRRTAPTTGGGGGGGTTGGCDEHSRPLALRMPWPHLVRSLREAGAGLSDCWERCRRCNEVNPEEELDDDGAILRRWEEAVATLSEAPMSVELLTATGLGKLLGKIIKSCNKRKQACDDDLTRMEEWVIWGGPSTDSLASASASMASGAKPQARRGEALTPSPTPPLARLERMLQGWKNLASKSGVVVTKNDPDIASSVNADDCSGRGVKTTEERHRLDLEAGRSCSTWRELFAALERRREEVRMSFGASLKKARRDLQTDRPRIKSVSLNLQKKRASKAARMEAMLNGERGINGSGRAGGGGGVSSSSSPPRGKMTVLRRETVVATTFQKGGVQRPVKTASGFGCSVASAQAPSRSRKRAAADVRRAGGEVALGGGKRMRMPGERAVAAVAPRGSSSSRPTASSSKSKLARRVTSDYKKSFGR